MIPVQLTIKGLYSYFGSVTIDFTPLVEAKLFGIFGPVGSGKSAILEAIMFVLFDRSNRLNKAGDDRYYNMMNLQSNQMIIDFIFLGGSNNKTKYRFYFMARRSTKEFRKVEVKDRSYYKWNKSEWQPLKTPEGLGMTYENFMQTVIIPQGKFRDFIDQKPKDRTQMLKELFHLDRFDIAAKAFGRLAAVKEQCKFIDGQLSQYLETSKVMVKQLEKEITSLESEIDEKSTLEEALNGKLGQMQLLQHLHQELTEVSGALSVLESEAGFFKNKQAQLSRYLKLKTLFSDKIAQQQQLLLKAKTKEQELSKLVGSVEELEKEVRKARDKWNEAKHADSRKESLMQQVNDIGLLIRLKDQQMRISVVQGDWEKAKSQKAAFDERIDKLEQEIEQLQESREKWAQASSSLQELLILDEWWGHLTQKQHQQESLNLEISNLKKDIDSLKAKHSGLKLEIVDQLKLKKKILSARELVQSLMLQDDWSTHAQHLKNGEPCPLCGATEHPNPVSTTGVKAKLAKATGQLTALEQDLEKQIEIQQNSEILNTQVKEKTGTLNNLLQKQQTITKDLKIHLGKYPLGQAPDRKPSGIGAQISGMKKSISLAEKDMSNLEAAMVQRKQLTTERQQHQHSVEKSGLEKEKLQGKIDELTGMIKSSEIQPLINKNQQQLEKFMVRYKEQIQVNQRNFQQSLERLGRLEKQLNHQKGLLQSTEIQVNEIKTQNITVESEMQSLCKKHGLKGVVEVQKVLNLNLNEEQERAELEKYKADLHTKRSRLKTLRLKIGKQQYKEKLHQDLKDEYYQVRSSLNKLRQQLSSKQHTLKQYQTQLEKKESLEMEFKKLTVRKDYIQEISNLLRGNGFINFISSVYLQNLCKSANPRFQKLTSNQLSLELSEQNEFLVRDHLNEGKLRLLKTLSGGQIFQASLSLALSLAENVKKLNQAEQSFFFLDEGFGSLDRTSQQLVFETLKSLQKENRIVGIISHVEELQLEIDTYLTVRQDQEKGSIIRRSWDN